MSRICSNCGKAVVVGQGKWAAEKRKPETLILTHKAVRLCEDALRASSNRQRAVQTARTSQQRGSPEEIGRTPGAAISLASPPPLTLHGAGITDKEL